MNAQLDEKEVIQLRNVLHKMADFIALYEAAEEKLTSREKALEAKIKANERQISEQLTQIRSVLGDFQEIMTEAGAARWRTEARNVLEAGKEHLENLQNNSEQFLKYTKQSCERLDKAAAFTVKNVSKAVDAFQIEDIRTLSDKNTNVVNKTCKTAINRMSEIAKWFHWKNLGMVLGITLIVTMINGLYINDEWPWQSHAKILEQRHLAQAVMSAWADLTPADRQHILHNVSNPLS